MIMITVQYKARLVELMHESQVKIDKIDQEIATSDRITTEHSLIPTEFSNVASCIIQAMNNVPVYLRVTLLAIYEKVYPT